MSKLKPVATWVLCMALSLVAVASLIAAWGRLAYGSVGAIPAIVRGQAVLVQPPVAAVGQIEPTRRYKASVDLINLTSVPVTVTGYHSACTCLSLADDTPLELAASSRRRVSLLVAPTVAQAGRPLSQQIDLYLSVPSAPTSIGVKGTVARLTTASRQGLGGVLRGR